MMVIMLELCTLWTVFLEQTKDSGSTSRKSGGCCNRQINKNYPMARMLEFYLIYRPIQKVFHTHNSEQYRIKSYK